MRKIKKILVNILKRIKRSNLNRLLKSRTIIKELKDKVENLEKDKYKLIDKVRTLDDKKKRLESEVERIPNLELVIESSDKSIKEKLKQNKELEDKRIELETKLFESNNELSKVKIQLEEYENQIADLKSDRYLVKKIKPGKTPNTIKTKISKPMSARVTKYMRGEHE